MQIWHTHMYVHVVIAHYMFYVLGYSYTCVRICGFTVAWLKRIRKPIRSLALRKSPWIVPFWDKVLYMFVWQFVYILVIHTSINLFEYGHRYVFMYIFINNLWYIRTYVCTCVHCLLNGLKLALILNSGIYVSIYIYVCVQRRKDMRSHETKLIFDCAFSLAIYIQVYIYVHMYAFSHAHMYTHIQTYVSLTSIIWVSVGLHVWVTYIWTNKSIHLHIYSLYVNYFIDTSKYFVTTLGLHRVYVGVMLVCLICLFHGKVWMLSRRSWYSVIRSLRQFVVCWWQLNILFEFMYSVAQILLTALAY